MNQPLQLAWAALEAQQFEHCYRFASDAMREDPSDPEPHLVLCQAAYHLDRYGTARILASRVIQRDPEFPFAYMMLALATMADTHFIPDQDAGICHLLASLPSQDSNPVVPRGSVTPGNHGVVDRVKADRDRITLARDLIQQAIRLDPEKSIFYGKLSSLELFDNHPELALAATDRGLGIDPDCLTCLSARMESLEKLGRLPEAINTGIRWLAIHPEDAECHQALGELYLAQGEFDHAQRHAREAVSITPDSQRARDVYWDTIRSRSRVIRPMVQWQYRVRSWSRLPPSRRRWISVIGFACLVAFGVLLSQLTGNKIGFLLALGCVSIVSWLVSTQRPLMLVADLYLFVRDDDFRKRIDRRGLVKEAAIMLGVMVLGLSLGLSAFGNYWPLGLLSVASLMLPSFWGATLLYSNRARALFITNGIAAMGVAIWSWAAFAQAVSNSTARTVPLYGWMIAIIISLAIPSWFAIRRVARGEVQHDAFR